MKDNPVSFPQFYLTAPQPCPYLPDRVEQKIFTPVNGQNAEAIHDVLSEGGFRRSHHILYRPHCAGCTACQSIRVLADEFTPTRSQRRIMRMNEDLIVKERPAEATAEQFALMAHYLDERHKHGGMDDMTAEDFRVMIDGSPIDTVLVEYRVPNHIPPANADAATVSRPHDDKDRLIGVALCDRMGTGWSMVYSFFDPDESKRSLGTFMILDRIMNAQEHVKPHIYLGFYVEDCRKMAYKMKYQPAELWDGNDWVPCGDQANDCND